MGGGWAAELLRWVGVGGEKERERDRWAPQVEVGMEERL
jgi:hypothetical protein